MDDFRKEVIKELEKKLGNGYCIFPKDKLKNNNFTVHGSPAFSSRLSIW